ncbi:MAG: hypothetical protein MUP76_07285 [Acidimicrobiia bacterium]|nr:hypothetical protein [Acidimicrobiia bacterium]
MDLDTVVLAAATAGAVVAQLGIVIGSRRRGMRGAFYVGLPAVALVALVTAAWMELARR